MTTVHIAGTTRKGAGGWAWLTSDEDREATPHSGAEHGASGYRMELCAIADALQALPTQPLRIRLANGTVRDVCTQYLAAWKTAGWRKKGGIPHLDILKPLEQALQGRPVEWVLADKKDKDPLDLLARERAKQAAEVCPEPAPPKPPSDFDSTDLPRVLAYTDGGCRGNPGIGGWGFLMIDMSTTQCLEQRGGEKDTTNNRMEMMAAIRVLQSLRSSSTDIEIRTDSRYLIDVCSKWVHGWKRNRWRKKDGEEVKNRDLVELLDSLLNRHPVRWTWIKGHAGEEGNEYVDQLANRAMDALRDGKDPSFRGRHRYPPVSIDFVL